MRQILYFIFVGISVAQICPPAEVLSPCTCRESYLEITCPWRSNSSVDLKGIFYNASQFVDDGVVFKRLYIPFDLVEIEEDTIANFQFEEIELNWSSKLEYISPRAFFSSRNITWKLIVIYNSGPRTSITFDVLNNFNNLTEFNNSGPDILEIPDRAFQNHPSLRWIDFYENNISYIGSKAFATGGNALAVNLGWGSIPSGGLPEDAFDGISPSTTFSINLDRNAMEFMEQRSYQTLLDIAARVIVGDQRMGSHQFYCDERADWICDRETAYRPKLEGFLCNRGSDFEDIWEYCATRNSTTICPPAEVLHPCTCSLEDRNTLTCHNINGEFNLKEILNSASQHVDDNVVFHMLNVSSTFINEIEDGGDLEFEKIILVGNRNLGYISPLAFSASKNVTNQLILDSNRISNEGPQDTDIFDFINSFNRLGVLGISHNLLKSIPDNAFQNPQLNNLTMMNNGISTIGSMAFAGATNLDQINLSYNLLTSEAVSEDAFAGISRSVSLVDLECNHGLEFMDQKIFQTLLDRVALVRLGGPACRGEDGPQRFHCDERADWICDDLDWYRYKIEGFLCKDGTGFEDVWDYCAATMRTRATHGA